MLNEKWTKAIAAMNKYDYEMDKSAQALQWIISEMEEIFEENTNSEV